MDQRLRELEAADERGDVEAGARLLVERVRLGQLDDERVRLAAGLGDERARLAASVTALDRPLDDWARGLLRRAGRDPGAPAPQLVVRAGLALALHALTHDWTAIPPYEDRARPAAAAIARALAATEATLVALEAWLHAPTATTSRALQVAARAVDAWHAGRAGVLAQLTADLAGVLGMIEHIKHVRELTGEGLRAAREVVDTGESLVVMARAAADPPSSPAAARAALREALVPWLLAP